MSVGYHEMMRVYVSTRGAAPDLRPRSAQAKPPSQMCDRCGVSLDDNIWGTCWACTRGWPYTSRALAWRAENIDAEGNPVGGEK